MVKRIIKKIFLSKLSRKRENEFLKKYSSDLKTLEIGGKSRANAQYFPNLVVLNINPGPEIDIVADAENLEKIVNDESFDLVLCISVLEHTKHPIKIVNNIRRIVKKNGVVLVSVPFIMSLHDTPEDYWRFTKYGLLELFKDFELVEIKDSMTSLETIGYLYHRLFLQTKSRTMLMNIFYFIFSKFNYLIGRIKIKEFGHFISYKNKRAESHILSCGVLGVFRKK